MAAARRIQFGGAIYHVTARGNGQQPIYDDALDFDAFLGEVEVTAEMFDWSCHGWCLMPNHYHLLIETPKANLSAGMQRLNNVYSRRFNRRHGRKDHLFRARFHSVIVETDGHMLEIVRYLPLNPVRARICSRPGDWRWSSFRATIGLVPKPAFLTLDRVLGYFGAEERIARRRYISFVEAADAPQSLPELEARVFVLDQRPAAA
jgi:REP-associated tyrosine transposase